jgi:hypothetical protein
MAIFLLSSISGRPTNSEGTCKPKIALHCRIKGAHKHNVMVQDTKCPIISHLDLRLNLNHCIKYE